MQGYITLDGNGWIESISTCETGLNYDAHIEAGDIPVADPRLIQKLINFQPIIFYNGTQFCQVKNPKDIWKRIRASNIHGVAASIDYHKYTTNLDPSLPDIPPGIIIDEPLAVKKSFDSPFDFEFKPGLRICQSTEDDADIWETAMISSQLYTKEQAWEVATRCLSDPLTWNTKVVWNDKILQLENYHFQLGSTVVWNGFQARIDRTRPSWFYRQIAKPLLQALYREGIETVMATIRSDRQDWADYLKEAYGSEQLKATDKGIIFRTRIKDSLALIPEWPARRTMGIDWKWEKNGVLVREATENDFPAIYQAIDESWGDDPRKQLVISLFEDRWALDAAAILLTIVDGKILEARMFRERKEKTLSLRTVLLKTIIDEKTDLSFVGMLEWEKAVGYTDTSYILESKLYEGVKDKWRKDDWTIFSQNEDITEMRLKIEEVLAKKKTPK